MRLHPALFAALPYACDPAPGPIVLAGDHLDLEIDPGLQPCGDLVGHMDRFIELTADRWEVHLGDRRGTFHWLTRTNYEAARCPTGAGACIRGDQMFSSTAPADHELVHLMTHHVGYPPQFFAEGAADAFELPTGAPGDTELPGDTDLSTAMMAHPSLPFDQYTLAGGYTRFLIDRHGMPTYLELYASLERPPDLDEIDAVYTAVLGESLAESIAAFDEQRRDCPSSSYNFKLFECSGSPLAWDGERLLSHHDLACSGGAAFGPFGTFGQSRVYAHFVVETPGLFELSLAGATYSGVRLASCGGCDAPPPRTFALGDSPRHIDLAAGDYYLLMTGSIQQEQAVTIRLERLAD